MANTCTRLSNVLKDVWTGPNIQSLFHDEIDGCIDSLRRDMNRQFYGGVTTSAMPEFNLRYQPHPITMTPTANEALQHRHAAVLKFHKQRLELTKQAYAAAKRGGKPSYRQRQKNARKAKAMRGTRSKGYATSA